MAISAWIFMITVWAFILFMTVYSFTKLLGSRQFADPTLDDEHTPTFARTDED